MNKETEERDFIASTFVPSALLKCWIGLTVKGYWSDPSVLTS